MTLTTRGSGPRGRTLVHGRTSRRGLETWKMDRGRYRYLHQLDARIMSLLLPPPVLVAYLERAKKNKEARDASAA